MNKDTRAMRKEMVNGCSVWINAITRRNMGKILEFLQEESEGKKHLPSFTFAEISRKTGIARTQVRNACINMAFFKVKPRVKIFTNTFNVKNRLQLSNKVILLKK
jgi:hypothetical protein